MDNTNKLICENTERDLNMMLNLEKTLKDCIKTVLIKEYDKDWEDTLSNTFLSKEYDYFQNVLLIKEKREELSKLSDVFESKKGILGYLYLKDVFNIIIWFWNDFKNIFGDGNSASPKKLRLIFEELIQYRNKLAHPEKWYAKYQHFYFLGHYNYIMFKLNTAVKNSLLDLDVVFITEEDYNHYYLVKDEEKIIEIIKDNLKDLSESLHYIGAAGFLSEDDEYRGLLERINSNEKIEVCRFVDLMSVEELKECSEYYDRNGMKKFAFSNNELLEYIIWLGSQAKVLLDENYYNYKLIPFSGMPIWRFGINLIIFDKKKMIFVYRVCDKKNNAYIIEDNNVVKSFYDYVYFMLDKLRRYPATENELLEKIFRVPPSFGRDVIEEYVNNRAITDELDPKYINNLIHDLSQGRVENILKLKEYLND